MLIIGRSDSKTNLEKTKLLNIKLIIFIKIVAFYFF
jgi:hypothetical protein